MSDEMEPTGWSSRRVARTVLIMALGIVAARLLNRKPFKLAEM